MRLRLAALGCAALTAAGGAGAALAAQPLKSRWYRGETSQDTAAELWVGKQGKRVARFDFGAVEVACDTGGTVSHDLSYAGSIRIGPRGGFRGTLPNRFTNEGAMVVRGRFVARRKATGTVRYLDRGCIGTNTVTWTARVPAPR